jgi:hypothetical protein
MADEKSNSATFEEEIIKEKVAVHNAMQCSSKLRLIANGTET